MSQDLNIIDKKEFGIILQASGGILNRKYRTIVTFKIEGVELVGCKRTVALDIKIEEICEKYGIKLYDISNSPV